MGYHPHSVSDAEVLMLIRDILNLKGGTIYSIEPSGRLTGAVDLMVRHDVGSLVVIDAGRMVGLLTFREVLRALRSGSGSLSETEAREAMVVDPVCGSPDQTIDDMRELMTRHHVRYLPVQDGDQLLGVVSFHDVAKAVIKETSMENRLLKRYIEASHQNKAGNH
jgi:CBS domain-containing protein